MSRVKKFNKFGFWLEDGEGYENCPSIMLYLKKFPMPNYKKIVNFLNGGTQGIVGGFHVHCHITQTVISSSKIILNDDLWVWPDDLVHYVLNHNLHISDDFLEHIENHDYICQKVSETLYSDYLFSQIEDE